MNSATTVVNGSPAPRGALGAPSHWRSFLVRTVIALLAVAVLVGGIFRYRASVKEPLVRYETTTLDVGRLEAKVTATGAVSPLISVQVGSQVSGRIAELLVDFGSVVRRGQVIASIEPSLFRAAVAQAQANRAAARASIEKARAQKVQADRQLARETALLAEGLVSQADFDLAQSAALVAGAEIVSAQASAAQAQAALDQAALNLRYATIASPIDGVVISRNVDVGQTVAAALQAPTLFTIAQDLTRMQIDANVAEADVGKIVAGMPVTFGVDAHPGREFRGRVRQVRDNALTLQNVVTYDVVIDVDNSERLLKPGMTANVVLSYAKREQVLRLPAAAIRFRPDHELLVAMLGAEQALRYGKPSNPADVRTVWVLRGETPSAISVHVGVNDGSFVEVTSAELAPGARVVTEATKRAP
jgi:HlyD family secretion protein